jgi:hypothetical protein
VTSRERGRREQLEAGGDESAVPELASDAGLADDHAHSVRGVRITKGIQIHAVHIVAASIETYCQVTSLSGHFEEAFSAGDVHYGGLVEGD